MKNSRSAPSAAVAPQQRVYIGPSFRGVTSGTIYLGELPEHLKAKIQKLPALGELVVPIERLAQAQQALKDANSDLSMIYEAVLKKGE